MSEDTSHTPGSHDDLVGRLSAELAPVRRLKSPLVRAMAWLIACGAMLTGLLILYGYNAMAARLMEAPDLWLAACGATLTAVCAGLAAFETSVPGSSARWTLLPIPPLCLWIGASGMGCFRTWIAPETTIATLHEAGDCFLFIVALSLPLSILLFVLLRRSYPLQPNLTVLLGGLACAAAAASMLNIVHPYDAAITDLTVHLAAVLVVLLGCHLVSSRIKLVGL